MIDMKKREGLEKVATRAPWFAGRQPCLSSVVVCEVSKSNLVTTYADGGKSHGYQDTNLIAHYRNDAAQVNAWIREAVRLAGASALAASAHGDHDLAKRLRAHIEKVKL